jgi:CHASE2 domain-containing sensor protein
MKRNWQRVAIGAAIAAGSMLVTLLLADVRFFQLLDLKAQDAHFVLRGKVPTRDIVLIGIDDKALNKFPELSPFWHPYYAAAIRGAADAGAKVMVLDVAFGVPVAKYEPNNDAMLAEAYSYASPKMPVVQAFVASTADQSDPAYTVPVNMLASAFGTAAMANLTVDSDSFVRRQVLMETPKPGEPTTRGMALLAAEKFLGKDSQVRNGSLYLAIAGFRRTISS